MPTDGVTIEDAGTEIYRKFLAVASGEKSARNGRDGKNWNWYPCKVGRRRRIDPSRTPD